MRAHQKIGAAAPGPVTPAEGDDARELGSNAGTKGQGMESSRDCRGASRCGQALRVIEGESKAAEYLTRLRADQADPDELALIVSMLYGGTLRGFCRVIEKALGVHHA